ncbi:hypothetical protein V8F33_003719 [Rhypophila sp. PSN 637]
MSDIKKQNRQDAPIAIVGMGLRLPGDVTSASSYWDLLTSGRDARSPIPPSRFNSAGFYNPKGGIGSLKFQEGYFLSEPVDRFDAGFFSMSSTEVLQVDPEQRLLLEVMHEALENSGETNYRGSDIAVYAGSFTEDWVQMKARDPQDGNPYDITGMDDFILANRVSYEFDLHGPSMTIKTGCSSSLIALHLACDALQRGDCSGALVGAANLLLSPEYFIALENLGAISSSSNTFDANAKGYARAEAVNAVYVKRLDDALRDGNPIRAIVRSTAINADGKTVGMTNPSTDAQEKLIRRAYEKAGITNPGETPVIECHGTGTAAGDPLEVGAIVRVFGGGTETYIGGVKPNIGHGEGAAGLSSLIKAVLSLENATIAPNIKFNTPNPKIPFEEAKLVVPSKAIPWPEDRAKRISVNSFGMGGANAHVILEAPEKISPHGVNGHAESTSPLQRLLVFSAHSETSLTKMLSNYQSFTEAETFDVQDLAYTLGARRQHRQLRAFAVTDGKSPLQPGSIVRTGTDQKGLLFIFTGQGAQWPGMGKELIRDYSEFRQDIQQMDRWFAKSSHPPTWKMEDILINAQDIHKAEYAQPLCTAIQIGLVNLLRKWGIKPDGVVGHSSGEIAAAYAAGALNMKDAILVAFYRGCASSQQRRPGAMAAVGLGRHEVTDLLTKGTYIACENSRSSVTISGDLESVERTLDRVREARPGALARKLKVDRAYHSDHMKTVGPIYEEMISSITTSPDPLALPFFSSVTGQPTYDASTLGPAYWRLNMECPVLFLQAVESALGDTSLAKPFGLALELGPHAALSGPFRQICKDMSKSIVYNSCLSRGTDGTATILTAAGQLYCQGVTPEFAAMNQGGKTLANLPPYPWTHDTVYWSENRISREFRTREYPEHELLGARVIGGNDLEPSWRKMLRLRDVPWLADHIVADDVVFPAAGYIAIAGEAIRQLTSTPDGPGSGGFTVRSLSIGSAMPLQPGKTTELITRLQPHRLTDTQDSTWYDFSILSYDGNKWTRNCSGEVHAGNPSAAAPDYSLMASPAEGRRAVPRAKWYTASRKAGLEYGPAFQGIDTASYAITRDAITATVRTSEQQADDDENAPVHPTTVDQLLQLCIMGSVKGHLRDMTKLTLPVHISEIFIARGAASSTEPLTCDTQTFYTATDMLSARGQMLNSSGSLAVHAKGIQFRILDSRSNSSSSSALSHIRQLEWRPDIDLITNPREFIHETADYSSSLELVERLNILCAIETVRLLSTLDLSPEMEISSHMKRFKAWNERYVTRIQSEGSAVVPTASTLFSLSSKEARSQIVALTKEAQSTSTAHLATAVSRIFHSVQDIYLGQVSPLEVLLQDNILTEIYNFSNILDHSRYLRTLAHSAGNGRLRVLEIGAGTGGFTQTILAGLVNEENSQELYERYTYTDISSGFFKTAKERFAGYNGVEYKVLDITKPPGEQAGFNQEEGEVGSYDLVVAANCLHATPNLVTTLSHARSLLKPSTGRIMFLELCASAKWVNYIYGTLPGWWLGDEDALGGDGRFDEPYVDAEKWQDVLAAAGFERDSFFAIKNQKEPFQLDNLMVARAAAGPAPGTEGERKKVVSLLVSDPAKPTDMATALAEVLVGRGYETSFCSLKEVPQDEAGRDVISLLDVESISAKTSFFQSLTEESLKGLITLLTQNHLGPDKSSNNMVWLTGASQLGKVTNPHGGLVLGFARTLRLELGVSFATLEVEDLDSRNAWTGAVADVLSKLQKSTEIGKDWKDVDLEYALVNGQVQIPRAVTSSAEEVLVKATDAAASEAEDSRAKTIRTLKVSRPGLLSSLHWQVTLPDAAEDLDDGQVEIEVRAAGVNYLDVALAMGTARGTDTSGNRGLGIESAGVVTRAAPGSAFEVGDRVICWTASGAGLSTHLNTSANLCVKIPEGLSFDEAVTLPTAFATAIRGLVEIASLSQGETILIHSAADSIGLAAIQVATSLGLSPEEIFVTVSNPEEREFLAFEQGIPECNIFSAVDSSFVSAIMEATASRGVDVVVNSLSGELLHASWKCVAEGGNMVDLSGKDVAGNAKLDMAMFEGNRGFHGLDIAALVSSKPATARRLLETTVKMLAEGSIKPISPITTFPPSDIKKAFQKFQGTSKPIGALTIQFNPEGPSSFPSEAVTSTAASLDGIRLRKDRSYLLVGGLGGLGKSAAVWLAEHGAGSIIFFSRSASTFDEQSFALMRELEALGCEDVQFVAGSVLDEDDVNALVANASRPIAGVVNLAVVLNDTSLLDLDISSWETTTLPKTLGTVNLHTSLQRAQPSDPLDFFILLGSIYGVQGNPKQANYAAASTFMDSFVRYRHNLGLPASVIDLGVMEDVGFVSENQAMLDSLRRAGAELIGEKEFLGALGLAIRSGVPPVKSSALSGYVNRGQLIVGLGQHSPDARGLGRKSGAGSSASGSGVDGSSDGQTNGVNSNSNSGGKSNALAEFRSKIKKEGPSALDDEGAVVNFLAQQIGECLKTLLIISDGADLNLGLGLAELGVDSLIAIELQSWWVQNLGISVTILELTNSPSVLELGKLARKRILEGMGASSVVEGAGDEKANGVQVEVVEVPVAA